jgi:GT2 family glycosyltransferase
MAPVTLPLTDGRVTVPGNRWDLLADRDPEPARIAVVIPHYQQQRELELTLGALELQDHPLDLVEVVVADDGSAEPPRVPKSSLRISVVRQEDRGFRAAAARNLGAAQTNADVLCFLDADTVPEPSYLRRISRLPAMLPDALVVGRRRHADLTGWSAPRLSSWWSGDAAPPVLEEPRWLSDEYRDTCDLLHTDHRSYRYVISSVMCCSRDLFVDVGGFDESFVGYGGEDWEFAHRAVVNGAVLHHARDAVAWHDGVDWGARDVADRAAAKNQEALAVARLVTDPDARRSGLHYAVPDVAVEVDTTGHAAGSLVATLGSLLGLDVGIWLIGEQAESLLHGLGVHDSRLNTGPVPDWIRRRCRFTISTSGRPVLTHEAVTRLLERCAQPGVGSLRVSGDGVALLIRASWATNRARRWTSGPVRLTDSADVDRIGENVVLTAESVGMGSAPPDTSLAW